MSQNLSMTGKSGDDPEVKRDEIVMVRLTAEAKRAWQAAADADQRKLSDWIRIACNGIAPPPRRKARTRPSTKGGAS